MNIFVFPYINPVAFSLGPLHVKWYGLMYLFSFLAAWGLAHYRVKKYQLDWQGEQIADLIFYGAMGAIIGGRSGYMLFYDFHQFIREPWLIFKVWEGGMSFHGGLIGVIIAMILFARKTGKNFLEITDFIAPLAPIGLGLGRLGNFINGELWGRPTTAHWGVIFPFVDERPRHPSQLYEFLLEGIVLFTVLWLYSAKPRSIGRVSALFLIGYGLCRFVVEFFREPDIQLGYVALNWLTMGQLLSLPMIAAGLILWWMKR